MGLYTNRDGEISEEGRTTTFVEEQLSNASIISTGNDELDAVNILTQSITHVFASLNLTKVEQQRAWTYINRKIQDDIYAR